jgi:hypothetical protein
LSPLTKSESRSPIEDILQKMTDGVPLALRNVIVSNAEGNPFYNILGLICANLGQNITFKENSLDARQCFENALRIFSEIKTEAPLARTLRSFARYENKHGNSTEVHKMINEAREIFSRLEMPTELERSFLI